uniref:Uncharacterized protein n=2 Tax=Rhizobium meliloti TaxID=382 RepID=I2E1L2_RHIML|nr:hypothetical protein pHRC017_0238 [Sinorhizobium meliloti]
MRLESPIASGYVTKEGNPMTDWRNLTEEDAIHTAVDEHGKDATDISSLLRS